MKRINMHIKKLGIVLLLLSIFFQTEVYAQITKEDVAENDFFKNRSKKLKQHPIDSLQQSSIQAEFETTGIPAFDSAIQKTKLDDRIFTVEHTRKTFTQQYYSSMFIFIMVVIIVGMGLILSFKQFKLNEEIVRHSMKQNTGAIDKGIDTASSMEVSKDGVKMNTAVIGLMILIISLVFFFLYLKFVYQIEVIK